MHSKIKDVRAEAFKPATGRLAPRCWGILLMPLEVPERQLFFVNLLARSLKALGDPDYDILVSGEECSARGLRRAPVSGTAGLQAGTSSLSCGWPWPLMS